MFGKGIRRKFPNWGAVSFFGIRLNDLVVHLLYIPVLILYAILALGHFLPWAIGDKIGHKSRWVAGVGTLLHLLTLVLGAFLGNGLPGFPEVLCARFGIMTAMCLLAVKRGFGIVSNTDCDCSGTSLVVPSRQIVAMEGIGVSPWLPIHLGLIASCACTCICRGCATYSCVIG